MLREVHNTAPVFAAQSVADMLKDSYTRSDAALLEGGAKTIGGVLRITDDQYDHWHQEMNYGLWLGLPNDVRTALPEVAESADDFTISRADVVRFAAATGIKKIVAAQTWTYVVSRHQQRDWHDGGYRLPERWSNSGLQAIPQVDAESRDDAFALSGKSVVRALGAGTILAIDGVGDAMIDLMRNHAAFRVWELRQSFPSIETQTDAHEPEDSQELDFFYRKDLVSTMVDPRTGHTIPVITREDLYDFAAGIGVAKVLAGGVFNLLQRSYPESGQIWGARFENGVMPTRKDLQDGLKVADINTIEIARRMGDGRARMGLLKAFRTALLTPPESASY